MELFIGWLLGMASLSVLLWIVSTKASKLHTGKDDHLYNFDPPTAPLAPKRNDWAVTSTGEVASLDDVPKGCTCDWEGDYIMCQETPVSYVLGRIDEACPVHGDPEAYYWTHRRDL